MVLDGKPKPKGARPNGKRPRRPPGRPPHTPTEESRRIVERLVTVLGATHDQVAAVMGLSRTTVHKHYRAELRRAALKVDVAVAQTFVRKMLGGPVEEGDANWRQADSALLRFYLVRRLGWHKPTSVDLGG